MNEEYILIAGLPESGKSTFIGALSYVLSHNQGKALFQTNANTNTYVTSLAESWMNMEQVNRSHAEDHDQLDFEVKKNEGEPFKLIIPDFMGESFQRVIEQKEKPELNNWYIKTKSLFLLMRQIRSEFVAEDNKVAEPTTPPAKVDPLTVKLMSYQAKNIMLLKYLGNQMKIDNLILGISAWDELSTKRNPKEYLKYKMPAFYNFVERYWPDTKVYGVSAQGGKYKKDDDFIDSMQEKAIKGERAYVVGDDGQPDYDITIPLSKLI